MNTLLETLWADHRVFGRCAVITFSTPFQAL
jgi:hypothetical protein